jgi:hypothetical protein
MTTKSFGGMLPRLIKMNPKEEGMYSDPKSVVCELSTVMTVMI